MHHVVAKYIYIVFYAVSVIFRPYNGGPTYIKPRGKRDKDTQSSTFIASLKVPTLIV